ncbi:MAG: hypothetical protein WKG52_19100 [Variovorax sp.]
MSISVWSSVLVFTALLGVVAYYKLTPQGRRRPGRIEAFAMIAVGLLNILAVGDIAAESLHRWVQLAVAGSGAMALVYGLYLALRDRQRGR